MLVGRGGLKKPEGMNQAHHRIARSTSPHLINMVLEMGTVGRVTRCAWGGVALRNVREMAQQIVDAAVHPQFVVPDGPHWGVATHSSNPKWWGFETMRWPSLPWQQTIEAFAPHDTSPGLHVPSTGL